KSGTNSRNRSSYLNSSAAWSRSISNTSRHCAKSSYNRRRNHRQISRLAGNLATLTEKRKRLALQERSVYVFSPQCRSLKLRRRRSLISAQRLERSDSPGVGDRIRRER